VYPLIQAQCLGCHNNNAQSGSVNLEGHANTKRYADNGRLFGSINHSSGFAAMPPTGQKIRDCDIAKIRAWINAGAPNN
jgi:mono/diheme cytochrome c family protein